MHLAYIGITQTLSSYAYTLDAAGQHIAVTETLRAGLGLTPTTRVMSHTYDALDRLVQTTYSTGEAFAYQYDAAGNRTVVTGTTPVSGTVVTTNSYDAGNRLTARSRSDGHAYTYNWSQRGQLLTELALSNGEGWTQGYPVRAFSYDGAGRMIEARVFTQTTEFEYNGLGARVAVSVDGYGTTRYTLDYAAGNRILAETTPTETVSYLYPSASLGTGGHDCAGSGLPVGEQRDDEWLYYLHDAEGYVRQGTDADGAIVSAWLFDPDGTVLEGPAGPVSHLVCGGVYDWSTGLIYRGGRYFDPNLGIWLALLPLMVVQAWPGGKKKGRSGHPWMVILCIIVVGTLTGCPSYPTPPATPTATRTPIVDEMCTTTPTPMATGTTAPPPTETLPPPTDTPPTPEGCCDKGCGPEPTPPPEGQWNSMDDYYNAQQHYAQERTSAYTQEERMLARMIWNEQRDQGQLAMRAAAWSVINRMNDTANFGHVNTIQAVLEDTRFGDQYHGYPGTDPMSIIERMGSGDGFRVNGERNDRELWFDALDIACKVICGCGDLSDNTKGYLWFGNGGGCGQICKQKRQVITHLISSTLMVPICGFLTDPIEHSGERMDNMSKLMANCFLGMVLTITLATCGGLRVSQTDLTKPTTLLYDTYNNDLHREEIYQFDMETQTSHLWLAGEGHLSRPLRSPDRTQVAYLLWNEIDEYFSLWLADANGQNSRQLGDTHLCADGPMVEWSFDSRYIAFRSTPGNNTAYIHILDTITNQEVLFIGGSEFDWSPTASRLAVSSGGGLVLIDVPERTEQWLCNDIFRTELYISDPQYVLDWLPDGRTVVFVGANRNTLQRSIYAVDIDDTHFRNLIPDITQLPERYIGGIQVSPNGKYVLGADGVHLFVLEIDNGEMRALASGLSGPRVWAPDSASIVFGSYEDTTGGPKVRTWELFQVALVDGAITRLTYDGAAPVGLTW